ANERLIPILMTAAVTALGLAPLAFGLNRPGQEIEGPMAVTVLGGLLSSTVLNLLVLPALAQRYVRVAAAGSARRRCAHSRASSPRGVPASGRPRRPWPRPATSRSRDRAGRADRTARRRRRRSARSSPRGFRARRTPRAGGRCARRGRRCW